MSNKKAGLERPYTIGEFIKLIKDIMNKNSSLEETYCLDYFDAFYPEKDIEINTFFVEFTSETTFGSSEGIYSDFYLMNGSEKINAFTAKTLLESDDAFVNMHVFAAKVCLMANNYILEHQDVFNWTGYNLSYINADGKEIPYCWCPEKDRALDKAKVLKDKGYETIIRDNATRKFIQD